jgi:hypothetical protein
MPSIDSGYNFAKLKPESIEGSSEKTRVFVLGKPFQSSLMFVDEARRPPKRGVPERCFTQVGSSLTRKHYTRLERLAKEKYSSLLRESVNYDRKKF